MDIAKSVGAGLKCDPEGIDGLLSKYSSALSINSKLPHTELERLRDWWGLRCGGVEGLGGHWTVGLGLQGIEERR